MEPDGIKSVPFKVKGAGPDDGLQDGQFEGYASVFGNVDSYGDIVVKGAFADTLAEWQEKGDPIPLLWGHDFADPFSNIGAIDSAEEDDHGLKVRGTFDLDNPKAAQVYKLAKGRRTTGMSFAYNVLDSERKEDANYLQKLHIFEASIVPIGANPLAGVDAVKSDADLIVSSVKAGKVLSAKNETKVREAISALQAILAANGEEEDQEPKASGDVEAKPDASDEERSSAKSPAPREEPTRGPSAEDLAAKYNYYAMSYGENGVLL